MQVRSLEAALAQAPAATQVPQGTAGTAAATAGAPPATADEAAAAAVAADHKAEVCNIKKKGGGNRSLRAVGLGSINGPVTGLGAVAPVSGAVAAEAWAGLAQVDDLAKRLAQPLTLTLNLSP